MIQAEVSNVKIQEIARLAGVSTATVSRVFSHHPNVRREVSEHVLAVAREHNYHPRLSGKQRNIVLLSPYKQLYPSAEFVDMVSAELFCELAKRRFRIEIIPHDNLERLHEITFSAAIGIGLEPPEKWDRWFGVPLVVVDKIPARKYPGIGFVHSDEAQGMELAIQHLVERGCRKPGALIHGILGSGNVQVRQKALLQSLEKHHCPALPSLVRVCTQDDFFEEMGKLLQQGIDGVFCGGGSNFGGLAAYCLSLYGKKIPEEIRLVSSERHRISRYCIPAQTTITQDYQALAVETISLLEKMLCGGKPTSLETVLPYSLIVRDST